ncbi:methyltransferase small [Rhodospirillum rubrum F11]|uniref:Methyltransferase small n=1 Tax=Rhodospirillum rubrum (strain ATCC 11170 / ATH 1.1.1 / DSM 467 / LMG 4362 / NCIMB 8255 / S1) TaxID=269796 RepID=Q2RQ46_RHORT|nr:methyltransferase [Rhodospirillum rubrum]ABC23749.1 Methyltransferase small [Rhodospirillum rubrum ATCC 11170]AEO49488.1 methyltransferase small [Rhodospirillum rubrum F11]MBK5955429.1 SAM-dependent methyltransferase [Rhodospirillum rubrum]QXG79703.1 methyltransferase [Rhodospirillum rubrum]HAQ00759.1 SAM-dependent methyltransferase [Rhodospirillum rubrum]
MTQPPVATPAGAPAWREDGLLDGRLRLMQPVDGYKVAIDSVLLAAAVDAAPGAHVLDAGAGTGAALLCLAARRPDLRVTGLELQALHAGLCHWSIELNALAGRARVMAGDLDRPPPELRATPFDAVMTNPPFTSAGTPPPDGGRARAMMEGMALERWVARCLALLRPKGRFFAVHRADRLDDLISALTGRAGEITVLPLWSRAGRPAERVIVAARKGVRGGARLLPGLVLHQADATAYTDETTALLRSGKALDLDPLGRL